MKISISFLGNGFCNGCDKKMLFKRAMPNVDGVCISLISILHAVPSQVVQANTLRKGEKAISVITKICAQIGVKQGGALWAVTATSKLNTMVIGYDIYKEKNSATVCAMVAALNDQMTSYTSVSHIQDSCSEKVSQSFRSAFMGEELD